MVGRDLGALLCDAPMDELTRTANAQLATGCDRATVLRWDMAERGAQNDAGYYCYLWGISYRTEEEIKSCISARRAEVMA